MDFGVPKRRANKRLSACPPKGCVNQTISYFMRLVTELFRAIGAAHATFCDVSRTEIGTSCRAAWRGAAALLAVSLSNCSEPQNLAPVPAPELLALSTYRAALGEVIDIYGTGFQANGKRTLHFIGTFTTHEGQTWAVDHKTKARFLDQTTLRWTTFGPFGNPMVEGLPVIGRFTGTVQVVGNDGMPYTNELSVALTVEPSIAIREFEPVEADCPEPAERGLGGMSYRIRAEALGFQPKSFTYGLMFPELGGDGTWLRRQASAQRDAVSEEGLLRLPPVPDGQSSYRAVVLVSAMAENGPVDGYRTAFSVQVHRPIDLYYNGNFEIAEVLPPVPVSACTPGGEAGRDVRYEESRSEVRDRGYAINWDSNWIYQRSRTQSQQNSETYRQQNEVSMSTQDERNFSWSFGSAQNGSVGIPEVVSLGMNLNQSVAGGGSAGVQNAQGRTEGLEETRATTETAQESQTVGQGRGENFSWRVSSADSVAKGFSGTIIPGTFGVFYRQTTRLLRRAAVVSYNMCGAAKVVGELDFFDYAWSPDLALGQSCPPLPEPNLPEAFCRVEPCENY